jgi:pimeloyl-ACP methyl ester carboxylesterase
VTPVSASALSPDGIPIRFDVDGSAEPTLVFIHGWSCDRTYWAPQMRAFAPRHRVVAVDLAGHGESGTGRASWTMPAFGADVVAVADQLGLTDTVLVGHSMGGFVIVEAALTLGQRVRGVVPVDTYRSLDNHMSPEEVDAFVESFRADFAPNVYAFVRTLFASSSDPELVERVAADMLSAPPDVALHALGYAVSNGPAFAAGVRQLLVPVVSITPDYRPTDEASLRRHGLRPVILSDTSHFLMMEAPDRFNALLESLVADFAPAPEAR